MFRVKSNYTFLPSQNHFLIEFGPWDSYLRKLLFVSCKSAQTPNKKQNITINLAILKIRYSELNFFLHVKIKIFLTIYSLYNISIINRFNCYILKNKDINIHYCKRANKIIDFK